MNKKPRLRFEAVQKGRYGITYRHGIWLVDLNLVPAKEERNG